MDALVTALLAEGLAQELAGSLRRSVAEDWTARESVRAQLCVLVKRTLLRYGYPPDKQEKATQTVVEQAEALPAEWAGPADRLVAAGWAGE